MCRLNNIYKVRNASFFLYINNLTKDFQNFDMFLPSYNPFKYYQEFNGHPSYYGPTNLHASNRYVELLVNIHDFVKF